MNSQYLLLASEKSLNYFECSSKFWNVWLSKGKDRLTKIFIYESKKFLGEKNK
jgi:hypothetical protein